MGRSFWTHKTPVCSQATRNCSYLPRRNSTRRFRLAKDKCANSSTVDYTLVEALCQCYHNSSQPLEYKEANSSRRQIIADKVKFNELEQWIPDLTRYRSNIAPHHTLLQGGGSVLPPAKDTRMYMHPGKLDHFLTFIVLYKTWLLAKRSFSCLHVNR